MQQSHNTDQKKTTQEMFSMASQISEMEEKLRDSQAADRAKAELIHEMKKKHQAEQESFSHSSKLSSRQQVSLQHSLTVLHACVKTNIHWPVMRASCIFV